MYCTKLKMIRWYLYETCLPTQCILGKLGQKQIRSIVRDLNDFTIQPYLEEALAQFFCSLKLVKFYSKVIIFVCFKWFSKRDGERKSEFFGKFKFAFLSEFCFGINLQGFFPRILSVKFSYSIVSSEHYQNWLIWMLCAVLFWL